MLKGVNRRVVVVKGDGKSPFETAYLILKKNAAGTERDIIKEANKLLGVGEDRRRTIPLWSIFLLGVVTGAAFSYASPL